MGRYLPKSFRPVEEFCWLLIRVIKLHQGIIQIQCSLVLQVRPSQAAARHLQAPFCPKPELLTILLQLGVLLRVTVSVASVGLLLQVPGPLSLLTMMQQVYRASLAVLLFL